MKNSVFLKLILLLVMIGFVTPRKRNYTSFYKNLPDKYKSVYRLLESRTTGGSILSTLLAEYNNVQKTMLRESLTLTSTETEAKQDLEICMECHELILAGIDSEISTCWASCLLRQSAYRSFTVALAETSKDLFCKPLGFNMMDLFPLILTERELKQNVIFKRFPHFYLEVMRFMDDTLTLSSLVEFWMSNLLLVTATPTSVYVNVRGNTWSQIDNELIDHSTPAKFAQLCESLDISLGISTLVRAVNKKSYVLDVLLPGAFLVRTAAYYVMGGFSTLFGVMMEALDIMIGTKCDYVSYALGEELTVCDELGAYPMAEFPVPDRFVDSVKC